MDINVLVIVGLVITITVSLLLFKVASDRKWSRTPIHNFPFVYKGKQFWFSRTVGISHAVFAKNNNDMWCVLAKKRGVANSSFTHLWTLPCVYLNFHQTGEQAAQKETYESTNVFVRLKNIHFFNALTSPSVNKQNVELQYYTIINDVTTENMPTSLVHTNERVSEQVEWIPMNEIQKYNWAFNHDDVIMEMFESGMFEINPSNVK